MTKIGVVRRWVVARYTFAQEKMMHRMEVHQQSRGSGTSTIKANAIWGEGTPPPNLALPLFFVLGAQFFSFSALPLQPQNKVRSSRGNNL